MTTLEDIRKHMLDFLHPIENEDDDEGPYDEDGHCSDSMWNEIRAYWEDFKTDKDFQYVVSCEWAGDEIDLDGGRNIKKTFKNIFLFRKHPYLCTVNQ